MRGVEVPGGHGLAQPPRAPVVGGVRHFGEQRPVEGERRGVVRLGGAAAKLHRHPDAVPGKLSFMQQRRAGQRRDQGGGGPVAACP